MRVLITGAAGFLGQGLVKVFGDAGHALRLMDVRPFDVPGHEMIVGSVADLPTVRAAMIDMEALVIAHMAPRAPDSYAEPPACFEINVKGTANLLFAAHEAGVRRVVLISSTGAVTGHPEAPYHPHDLPPKGGKGLYGLTKALQEVIAEQFARDCGLAVAVLRMGHVVDLATGKNKYGRDVIERGVFETDRHDIAEAALRCLAVADLTYETFYVTSIPDAPSAAQWDLDYTFKRLNWRPGRRAT